MFTGLIKEQGKIVKIIKSSHSIKLTIQASKNLLETYKIGDSMAVNGVCLTCVQKSSSQFTVDIMPETYKRTTFKDLKINDAVHLEPAMGHSDRFEGHIVSGHSDGLAQLAARQKDENAILLTFSYPSKFQGEIINQGSITINGISLTVVTCDNKKFTVSLIPHTAKHTNLEKLKIGDSVNIETDILAKYIKAQLKLFGGTEFVTGETVNFMAKHARGLICAPVSTEIAKRLNLHSMLDKNTDPHETAFTVSVDHKTSTTGISAFERATTIKELASPNSRPDDFNRPGHMFPLIGRDGGIKVRRGHTEASLDLARLANSTEATYICEIMNEDGTMARRDDLYEFAKKWNLTVVDLDELTRFLSFEDSVKVKLPTEFGDFDLQLFEDEFNKEHLIISKGDLTSEEPLLIRVHSECLTGDVFTSHRCDCGEQLHAALQKISDLGRGAVLYLRQEGRGIGLRNKLLAYQLQEQGVDTYEANVQLGFAPDERDYTIAVDMLDYLGIKSVKLLTNNPDKVEQLSSLGINVVDRVPINIKPQKENKYYLQTKKIKFNHFLDI